MNEPGGPAAPGAVSMGPVSVMRFAELDSTSLFARRGFECGALGNEPVAIISARQTGGVGRFGRAWDSPEGGLWYTLVWPLGAAKVDSTLRGLGLRVGVAAAEVVEELLRPGPRPCTVRMKWPNDVLVNGKKVCGVLCELVRRRGEAGIEQCVLVGVGININLAVDQLRPELRDCATTVREQLGCSVDLVAAGDRLTEALIAAIRLEGLPDAVLSAARARLHGVGERVSIALPGGGRLDGVLDGLDAHGMAVVRTESGLVAAPSGSVVMGVG